jgi:tetratricopeptide (TPR) repeat protein
MKRILFAFTCLVALSASAQVRTPQASPKAVVRETVGLTEVEIEYSRPGVKGRTIFGDLVPFGKMWRMGANANSTVSFSEDVVVDGKTLPKGKYAIFATPRADMWEIIFYSDTNNWGLPEQWSDAKAVLRTNVKPEMLNRNVESLTIGVNNLQNDSANLEISWEKTVVPVKFQVPTHKAALASIEKVLAGPTSQDYFSAAQYFYQSNGDLNRALTYVNKALELSEQKPFYFYRQKSLIQAKLGDKKGAIETAKISLAASQKANNADYVKMNQDSINEWSKK